MVVHPCNLELGRHRQEDHKFKVFEFLSKNKQTKKVRHAYL
jgi:hypothetical protein